MPPWPIFLMTSYFVPLYALMLFGIGLLGSESWWPLSVSLGLLLAVAAWFQGTKLGLWLILIVGGVLRLAMVIEALLKYG